MTIERLEQFIDLQNEIELYKRKLEDAKTTTFSDTTKGSQPEYPYITHSIPICGVDSEYVSRVKVQLSKRIQVAQAEHEAIEKWIDNIPDSRLRLIVHYKYIEKLSSWGEVARAMGCIGDGSTERKQLQRYLRVSHISQ